MVKKSQRATESHQESSWWVMELGCWTMVALSPILTWMNGPAVSTDQAVVRALVFAVALAGGSSMTAVRRLRK